mmetsp:Transcript_9727/g.23362  ORF Transcript_9727/g.23362 Transcript_9727/m.23362 type:complete len:221 (+) Transcript_9727:1690-2352(+)
MCCFSSSLLRLSALERGPSRIPCENRDPMRASRESSSLSRNQFPVWESSKTRRPRDWSVSGPSNCTNLQYLLCRLSSPIGMNRIEHACSARRSASALSFCSSSSSPPFASVSPSAFRRPSASAMAFLAASSNDSFLVSKESPSQSAPEASNWFFCLSSVFKASRATSAALAAASACFRRFSSFVMPLTYLRTLRLSSIRASRRVRSVGPSRTIRTKKTRA